MLSKVLPFALHDCVYLKLVGQLNTIFWAYGKSQLTTNALKNLKACEIENGRTAEASNPRDDTLQSFTWGGSTPLPVCKQF